MSHTGRFRSGHRHHGPRRSDSPGQQGRTVRAHGEGHRRPGPSDPRRPGEQQVTFASSKAPATTCGTFAGWRAGGRCVRRRLAHNNDTTRRRGLPETDRDTFLSMLRSRKTVEEAAEDAGVTVRTLVHPQLQPRTRRRPPGPTRRQIGRVRAAADWLEGVLDNGESPWTSSSCSSSKARSGRVPAPGGPAAGRALRRPGPRRPDGSTPRRPAHLPAHGRHSPDPLAGRPRHPARPRRRRRGEPDPLTWTRPDGYMFSDDPPTGSNTTSASSARSSADSPG